MIKWIKKWFAKPVVLAMDEDEENRRWELFIQSCNERKEKHKKNLHETATGCRVGLKWTPQEDVMVIMSLYSGITLMELSEYTGRPVFGITSRMSKQLKVLQVEGHNHNVYVPRTYIYKSSYSKFAPEVLAALLEKGWKQNGNRLDAPNWWTETHRIRVR